MAEKTTLARPYAKAVFEFAKQGKAFEEWSEVLTVLSIIASDSRVVNLLKDRNIPLLEIIDFFNSVAERILDEHSKNLILILVFQRRAEVLPEIKVLYEELREKAENTAKVKLITAIPLNAEEKLIYSALLQFQYLEDRNIVNMNCEVDKTLLGGFVATSGNKVIDGSVRSFLTNLKETMGESIWV